MDRFSDSLAGGLLVEYVHGEVSNEDVFVEAPGDVLVPPVRRRRSSTASTSSSSSSWARRGSLRRRRSSALLVLKVTCQEAWPDLYDEDDAEDGDCYDDYYEEGVNHVSRRAGAGRWHAGQR